jgi:hypothetical protein
MQTDLNKRQLVSHQSPDAFASTNEASHFLHGSALEIRMSAATFFKYLNLMPYGPGVPTGAFSSLSARHSCISRRINSPLGKGGGVARQSTQP